MIKGLSLDGVCIRYRGRNPDNGKARSRRAERVCQSGRVLQAHLRHVPVLEPRVHVPDIQSEFTADWRDRHTPLPFRAKTGIPSDGFRAGKSLRPVPVGIEGVQHLPVPVTGGRVVAVLQRIVLGRVPLEDRPHARIHPSARNRRSWPSARENGPTAGRTATKARAAVLHYGTPWRTDEENRISTIRKGATGICATTARSWGVSRKTSDLTRQSGRWPWQGACFPP